MKRRSNYGINRLHHLQRLIQEFENTDSENNKRQVLANLANFGYDFNNFPHFNTLKISDLFLGILLPYILSRDCIVTETDESLIEFASAGLCNTCIDDLYTLFRFKDSNQKIMSNFLATLYYILEKDSINILRSDILKQLRGIREGDGYVSKLAHLVLKKHESLIKC
ncbi:hypothetical protein O9G_003420 [Rozella allomycis CSF55]|uniref:Uncharacterized protein n=1 Tax=Rozella allomycis (strain CSF55) TaxID=988480 RepID=A0A075APX6_ROZAC|nr:hypothetical protein O9G_003420 [Rozella allomycis CSF55]|eukprot:EPZ32276.1 hypothetical protein O9G_003420 [Rozella allomycis CSF55]